jgi:PBP1b-binding outer membrane lipoprotein LpoB
MAEITKIPLATLAIFFCACTASTSSGDPDETSVKTAIENTLKKSDRVADVEIFLKTNGFEYSVYAKSEEIEAIKRDVRKQNVVSKNVSVKFTLHDGKITGFSTRVIWTGP